MANKWVDNEFYFGPDRRKGGLGKRWGDRREMDDAADPPPLGAVLRRMRVLLIDMRTAEERRHIMQLGNLAITEAEKMHKMACADAVKEALRRLHANDVAGADAMVIEAQANFAV